MVISILIAFFECLWELSCTDLNCKIMCKWAFEHQVVNFARNVGTIRTKIQFNENAQMVSFAPSTWEYEVEAHLISHTSFSNIVDIEEVSLKYRLGNRLCNAMSCQFKKKSFNLSSNRIFLSMPLSMFNRHNFLRWIFIFNGIKVYTLCYENEKART